MYGIGLGMGLLCSFALLTRHTYMILDDLVRQSGKKSYANMCSHFLGRGPARAIVLFMIFSLQSWGILYASVSWQFLSTLIKDFGWVNLPYSNPISQEIDQNASLTVKWRFICMGIMALFVFPFVYQKSLGTLRYVSVYIFCAMLFTIVLVMVQFPGYFQQYGSSIDYTVELEAKKPSMKWFQGLATLMLSYYSQVLFFYVRGELASKTVSRVSKLVNILLLVVTIFFGTFACIGYLSLGDKMLPNLFTLRRPLHPGDNDYLMKTAQIALNLATLLKISIVLYPCREQILIFYRLNRTLAIHVGLTVLIVIVAFAVPALYPDIIGTLGLVGGVTMGTTGYTIPLMLKLSSLKGTNKNFERIVNYVLLAVVISIQILSVYASVFNDESEASGH